MSDSAATHKRIRPTNNESLLPNTGFSTRKPPVKKNQSVNGFFLPQLEESEQWPGRTEWAEFVKFDDPNGIFRERIADEEFKEAWNFSSKSTKKFLLEIFFPFFDKKNDEKSIMVAFFHLKNSLQTISASISKVFVEQASEKQANKKNQNAEDAVENAVEEIQIGDFFGGISTQFGAPPTSSRAPPTNSGAVSGQFGSTSTMRKDGFDDSRGSFDSRGSLGLRSINFETSSVEPSSLILNSRPEFVQGNVPSKRRKTTTPEKDENLIDEKAMSELSISSSSSTSPEKFHSQFSATPQNSGNFLEIEELENLPESEFREFLSDLKTEKIFRFLAKILQERWEVFPVVAQSFVHSVAKLYETFLSLEKGEDSAGWKDDDVRVELRNALNVFNKTLFVLGLCETVIAPALQILCRNEIKKKTSVFLRDGLSVNFADNQDSGFTTLSRFVHNLSRLMIQDESVQAATGHSKSAIGESSFPSGDSSLSSSESVHQLLLDYAKKEYIEGVVDGFFDLLLQWPRSRQNFVELKQLMDETSKDVIHAVIISLQRQFHSRLLRPGLNTQDILAVYTAAIRALRIIDPSRVIQDLVCEPVRMYLRSRPDTVRCIMSHITHISPVRESGDSRRRSSLPALDAMIEEEEAAIALTMLNPKNSTSDIDMENWKTWQPDPVYVELLPSGKRTDRQADTIELLMSIYGGQDVFINEYQLILAEKLLGYYPFDAEEEAKHLKMMTKRFGETLLQKSEVMSRDAADSQKFHERILTRMDLIPNAHKCIPLGLPVKTLVISHHYWPEIRTEKIKPPEILSQAIADYQENFEKISENRTIEIRAELGRVEFDLHLDDGRKMHLKCNPVYVAIILQFSQNARWSLEELAEAVGVSAPLLKKKLLFWQRRNVLEESEPDVFSVVAEGNFLSQEDLRRMDDEEIESAVRYVAENNQEEQNLQIQLQMFWKYMTTMLSTVQTITIDRLFAMVRMFIIRGQTKREVTIEHLRLLLDAKVRARELIYANNRYSLPKKETKEVAKDL